LQGRLNCVPAGGLFVQEVLWFLFVPHPLSEKPLLLFICVWLTPYALMFECTSSQDIETIERGEHGIIRRNQKFVASLWKLRKQNESLLQISKESCLKFSENSFENVLWDRF
jgi:hypothetical protein